VADKADGRGGLARGRWRAGSLTYTTGGLAGLFFWLLWGDFSFFLKERSVTPAMQLLLHRLDASNLLVGTLLVSVPAAIGFVVVPIVGYRSDRHHGGRGRRIPFLIPPIPVTLVAMAGLAFSPQIGRSVHRLLGGWSPGENASELIALAGSWALFEVCTGISNSVFLSLITDVVPGAVIGRFFALFRMVSLGAGMIFFYDLFGRVERHTTGVFLGIGAVYCVGFTAMCLRVREGSYPPPPPAGPRGPPVGRFLAGARTYCRDCFSAPYYRWVFLSYGLAGMASVALNSFYVLYAKSLGMGMATLGKYGAAQLLVSLLQAYPVGWLSDRFHPLRLTIVSLVLLAVATAVAFLTVHDGPTFGIALVACGSLTGFWLTSSSSLPAVLFPRQKFAVLNSARLTAGSVGTLVAGPACGWMLDLLHRDYRYLFVWWWVFIVLSLGATVAVYRRFVRLGGPGNYVPPE
jgi:MFS family permease